MIHKSWKCLWGRRNLALIVLDVVLILIAGARAVQAQNGYPSQAFGVAPIPGARGTRVDIWTANHTSEHYYIAGITGICTRTPTCSDPNNNPVGLFETGLIKGRIVPGGNLPYQYAAYQNDNGSGNQEFLDALNNYSWYTFQTLFSNTAQRWEAWRDGVWKYTPPSALNFTSGSLVACGAEGRQTHDRVPLGAECRNLRYKSITVTKWTQHEYSGTQINGPYCVYRPYQYGAFGWGPCY